MKINSAKLKLASLFSLITILVPNLSLAQNNPYSVNSRAMFLTGCLLDEQSNLQKNSKEVFNLMKSCVCILDKFQAKYTNQQFMAMFDQANKNEQPYKQELDNFVKQNILDCL